MNDTRPHVLAVGPTEHLLSRSQRIVKVLLVGGGVTGHHSHRYISKVEICENYARCTVEEKNHGLTVCGLPALKFTKIRTAHTRNKCTREATSTANQTRQR